jgi:hypothetical protein
MVFRRVGAAGARVASLPGNLGLDEPRQLFEQLLPAQAAHLERNGFGQALPAG